MKRTTKLRELMFRPGILVLPGVANCFEAKMVEAAGFEAVYMSGSRASLSMCGLPDAGLTTMTEMVTNARYIASSVSVPVLSDADTGHGNAINTRRTVQEFIAAGVAGIHIEDQVAPKRCGFIAGKEVIPVEEAAGKIRAAVDARDELDRDFLIIARTDARGAAGGSLEEAISRAKAYREAGADMSFVEGLESLDEVRRCVQEVGKPLMTTFAAVFEKRADQMAAHEDLEEAGLACAFYPAMGVMGSLRLQWEYLHDVQARGVTAMKEWKHWEDSFPWKYGPPPSTHNLAGFPKIRKLEEKYLAEEAMQKYTKSIGRYIPGESN